MGIVSSSFSVDPVVQQDGRVYVTETHTDDAGAVITIKSLAAVGSNHDQIMSLRALEMDEAMAQAEVIELTD